MMKFYKRSAVFAVVIITVMLCFVFSSSALTSGSYEYRLLDNGNVEITDYEGTEKELYVPSEIEGKRVSSIADGAFDDCPELNAIYLPVTLEYMGDTFYGCSGLVIYYLGDIYQWMNVEGWENVSDYFSVNTQSHVHKENIITGKAATCTATGLTEGKVCIVCSVITQKQTTIPVKPHTYTNACDTTCNICCAKRSIKHTYSNACDKSCNVCKATRSITHANKTTTTKATLKKNGKQVTKCTVCGDVSKTTTVYYPKTIKLEYTTATYNGKAKKPKVTVKDSKGKTVSKDYYTVKYSSGCKNPGKYTVTVTFKGKYEGTKKLTLTINPKAPSITDIYSKTKGKAVIKWCNVAGESGYQLYYATSKDGTYKKVNSYKANKLAGSKTKLKSGKKYYFKVRSYKKTSSGTVYSSWSKVKSVKIK